MAGGKRVCEGVEGRQGKSSFGFFWQMDLCPFLKNPSHFGAPLARSSSCALIRADPWNVPGYGSIEAI